MPRPDNGYRAEARQRYDERAETIRDAYDGGYIDEDGYAARMADLNETAFGGRSEHHPLTDVYGLLLLGPRFGDIGRPAGQAAVMSLPGLRTLTLLNLFASHRVRERVLLPEIQDGHEQYAEAISRGDYRAARRIRWMQPALLVKAYVLATWYGIDT
jgi:hypothetical protein